MCRLLKELGHLGPELGGHTNEGAALPSDHYIEVSLFIDSENLHHFL